MRRSIVRGAWGGSRLDAAEVLPGLLIGSAPGPKQRRALARGGVTLVVDLRDESPPGRCRWPAEVGLVLAPIEDRMAPDLATLSELSAMLAWRLGRGERVFVHCHAGIGRAATVACAVLMQQGMALGDAFRMVLGARRGAAPTDAQVEVLERLEQRLSPVQG